MLTSYEASKILLDIGAVNIRPSDPFTLTSGRKSPVYVDCRKIISYPKQRRLLMQALAQKVEAIPFAAMAGGETAGIPYAAWLSDIANVPMLYVRKKPKGFGRGAQIEGTLPTAGDNVLLVEDMTTDGGSKHIFVNAMREADLKVDHIAVVFYYDVFDPKPIQDLGVELHYLCTWADILAVCEQEKRLSKEDITALKGFLESLRRC